MPQKKVFITRKIPRPGVDLLLDKGYDVKIYPGDTAVPAEVLFRELQSAHALIPLLSDKIDKDLIASAPHLKIIANYAVGYNNIDVAFAKEKNIVVTNTPDVLTAATADLTWALILSVSKRIVEGDRFVRNGHFRGWEPELLLGSDISGKTLGIIGPGRIGRAVAKRALGFDMKILYNAKSPKTDFEKNTGARFVSLEDLLQNSDIISLHCPLTEETQHLLDHKNLQKIKRGAYLINTSRGSVIDEQALAEELQQGRLAGAGLDVYEFEPRVSEALLTLPQVVLLPHVGSGTVETRAEMSRICARNIIAVLEGKKPLNPVI